MRKVPVLITAFNRPLLLRGLLDNLRPTAPSRLFIAIDGPRSDVSLDAELVRQTKKALELIDWVSDVQILERETNLGCGAAMSSAITWFFDQVEEGIILEDDIRPLPEFFGYASDLLVRYRNDPRLLTLSGANSYPLSMQRTTASFRFSRYPQVWGWATWRDRWMDYRYSIGSWRNDWPITRRWKGMGGRPLPALMWTRNLDRVAAGLVDTWDYQLVLLAMKSGRFTTIPRVSLTQNVGFGVNATHTHGEVGPNLPTGEVPTNWTSSDAELDQKADRWLLKNAYGFSLSHACHKVAGNLNRRLRSSHTS